MRSLTGGDVTTRPGSPPESGACVRSDPLEHLRTLPRH